MNDRVRPLVEEVRQMIESRIPPLDAEFEAEVDCRPSGDCFRLTDSDRGHGLTTVKVGIAAEVFVDTGNREVFERFGFDVVATGIFAYMIWGYIRVTASGLRHRIADQRACSSRSCRWRRPLRKAMLLTSIAEAFSSGDSDARATA